MAHESVRLLQEPRALRDPIVIAGFADRTGVTAMAAVQHLVEAWEARPIAEIDAEEFFDFTVSRPLVRLEDGERVLEWPVNRLYVASPAGAERDVILFPGVEPGLRWRGFSEAVASLLGEYGAKAFVTLGAYAGTTPHTRPTPIRLTAADTALAQSFPMERSTSNYEGPVGISTVLTLLLGEAGFETASLYALTPFYAVANPHPHAMVALLETLDRTLGTTTPLTGLVEHATTLEREVAEAVEQSPQLRTVVQSLEEQFDWISGSKTALPPGPAAAKTLPSSEEIVADVERFLGEQRGGASSANGKTA